MGGGGGDSASQDEIAQGSDNSTDHLQEADGQDAALAGMLSYADLFMSGPGTWALESLETFTCSCSQCGPTE